MLDLHTHTRFSSDSHTDPEQLIQKAIEKNYQILAITDHYDYEYPYGDIMVFNIDDYFKELLPLKEKYKDRIKLLIGVEIGMQIHLSNELDDIVSSYPFDIVIGSTHLINNIDPYFGPFYEEGTKKEGALAIYFETIILNTNSIFSFDTMGHLDYLKRYLEYDDKTITYKESSHYIDLILKGLIERDKAFEVNTQYIDDYPFDYKILKRYKELGGKLVTIGSDSHKLETFAFRIEENLKLIKEAGFDKITYYEERVKKMIGI